MSQTTGTTGGRGKGRSQKVTDIKSKKHGGKGNGNGAGGGDGFTDGPENPNIRKQPKQAQLMDVDPVIPEVVKKAAVDYLEVLDERIRLQQREPDLRERLIDLMVHHKCTRVKINGETLTLETTRKVKKTTDKEGGE